MACRIQPSSSHRGTLQPSSTPRARDWLLWFGALAVVTAAMLLFRDSLEKAHVALVYLLLVLGASARSGRTVGLTIAVAAFFSLNFFFVPPHYTLMVAAPLDWLELAAFLLTSIVAAHLLTRAQSEAAEARNRADEVDWLSAIGAEALNAGRAEEALGTMAAVFRETLDVSRCEIYLRDSADGSIKLMAESGDAPDSGLTVFPETPDEIGYPSGTRIVEWVAETGRAVVERIDGGIRTAPEGTARADLADVDLTNARTLLLPLRVHGHTVGVLRLAHAGALPLDAPRRRFLEALSYYAALGVERVSLVADAENAEALRRADEMKNALLASVSHDLRTPLTTITALAHDIAVEGRRSRCHDSGGSRPTQSTRGGPSRFVTARRRSTHARYRDRGRGRSYRRCASASFRHAQRSELNVALDPANPLLLGRFDFVHSLRILVNLLEKRSSIRHPIRRSSFR